MSKTKKLAIVISFVCIALVSGILIFSRQEIIVERNLSLGNKYLQALDYERAIAEFSKVIEMDSSNAEAYLGLADGYVALGDTDTAVKILQQGFDLTGDNTIKNRLDRLKNQFISIDVTEDLTEEKTETKTENKTDNKESEWGVQFITWNNNFFYRGPYMTRTEYCNQFKGCADAFVDIEKRLNSTGATAISVSISNEDMTRLPENTSKNVTITRHEVAFKLNRYYLEMGMLKEAHKEWMWLQNNNIEKHEGEICDKYGRVIENQYPTDGGTEVITREYDEYNDEVFYKDKYPNGDYIIEERTFDEEGRISKAHRYGMWEGASFDDTYFYLYGEDTVTTESESGRVTYMINEQGYIE